MERAGSRVTPRYAMPRHTDPACSLYDGEDEEYDEDDRRRPTPTGISLVASATNRRKLSSGARSRIEPCLRFSSSIMASLVLRPHACVRVFVYVARVRSARKDGVQEEARLLPYCSGVKALTYCRPQLGRPTQCPALMD